MPTLKLAPQCSHSAIAELLHPFVGKADEERLIEVTVPPRLFVTPAATALLCAWGLRQILRGFRFHFEGERASLRYLARMNVQRTLEAAGLESFTRHPDAGRFVSVHTIETSTDCLGAVNAMGDMVLHQFENAHRFFPAMEWAVYELLDNIHIHAEAPCPGTVCAQFFPDTNRVQIGICDMGRGVRASLRQRYGDQRHEAAIALALEKGVTRDPQVGQGNGLAGTREIARANGAQFHLWSGDACYRMDGERETSELFPAIAGTGVHLNLNASNPVDLRNTYFGRDQLDPNESTYLNAEEERACENGLLVAQECVHTGGRPPAAGLRRKVEALLNNGPKCPLILDFVGVGRTTSSFLDELLGRLVVSVGPKAFRAQIRVTNISPNIAAMAENVISQRLALSAAAGVSLPPESQTLEPL